MRFALTLQKMMLCWALVYSHLLFTASDRPHVHSPEGDYDTHREKAIEVDRPSSMLGRGLDTLKAEDTRFIPNPFGSSAKPEAGDAELIANAKKQQEEAEKTYKAMEKAVHAVSKEKGEVKTAVKEKEEEEKKIDVVKQKVAKTVEDCIKAEQEVEKVAKEGKVTPYGGDEPPGKTRGGCAELGGLKEDEDNSPSTMEDEEPEATPKP